MIRELTEEEKLMGVSAIDYPETIRLKATLGLRGLISSLEPIEGMSEPDYSIQERAVAIAAFSSGANHVEYGRRVYEKIEDVTSITEEEIVTGDYPKVKRRLCYQLKNDLVIPNK